MVQQLTASPYVMQGMQGNPQPSSIPVTLEPGQRIKIGPHREIGLIPRELIDESIVQYRHLFTKEELDTLAESFDDGAPDSPVMVTPNGGRFTLIFGGRRLKASTAPYLLALISAMSILDASKKGLIENTRHRQLTPFEETEGVIDYYRRCLDISDADDVVKAFYRLKNRMAKAGKDYQLGSNPGLDEIDAHLERFVRQDFSQLSSVSLGQFIKNRLGILKYPEAVLRAMREGRINFESGKLIATKLKGRPDLVAQAVDLASQADTSTRALGQALQSWTTPEEAASSKGSDQQNPPARYTSRAQAVSVALAQSNVLENPELLAQLENHLAELERLLGIPKI